MARLTNTSFVSDRSVWLRRMADVLDLDNGSLPPQSLHTFAQELGISAEVLIERFSAAGIRHLTPEHLVHGQDKDTLLDWLISRSDGEPGLQRGTGEILYEKVSITPSNVLVFESINDELVLALRKSPELMYQLRPRLFEELVAHIMADHGFEVELTPPTKDGGFDIVARLENPMGVFLVLVECKRYAPDRKVGVEVVRGLYGVTEMHRAHQGIVVTSSSFTKGAVTEQARIGPRIALQDYKALRSLLLNPTRA